MILDADIAALYQVETRALVQAVKRNPDRFPTDFAFQLSREELENWRSQIVMSNPAARMELRRDPYAFTEHGVAMLSAVLRSDRAVQLSILVVRTFIKMRELLASYKDLAARVEKLEALPKDHASVIGILADEIEEMKRLPDPAKRSFGFQTD